MSVYVVALLVGIVAGMRAFLAPAAVSWASKLGLLHVAGTWAAFMSSVWAVGIFSVLTLVEFVTDTLPSTPSRKALKQFIPRVGSGAFSGAVVGATVSGQAAVAAALIGAVGAVIGTLGGYEFRARIARAVGKDLPVAVLEDVVAVGIAVLALVYVTASA